LNEIENHENKVLEIDGWTIRVRPPHDRVTQKVFLLLHGYTGYENSMTVFTRNLPGDAWIIQPRGPHQTNEGGYRWISSPQGLIASFKEFQQSVVNLDHALLAWKRALGIPDNPGNIIGFSQGAVEAMAYTVTFPNKVHRAACLSGFIPDDTQEFVQGMPLLGKPIFMAHGTEDTTVPFSRAQKAREILAGLGAQVTFCSSAVGHRINASCFRGYSNFFREN